MPKHGKKYREAAAQVDTSRLYSPQEAIDLLKKISYSAFDGTVEVHMRLGVDPRHADQMVRGTAVLPHGTGRTVRVLVFAQGDKAREAEEAGAEYVGAQDLIQRIEGGWLDFDVAVATPDMMGQVGRLGRILGPRGLMPNPRSGTVTFDVGRTVRDVKAGRVEFRVDRTALVHVPIGKVSFDDQRLLENLSTLMDAVVAAKPSGAKGTYIRSVHLAATMSPGIRLDPGAAQSLRAA
ncbi:MAG TPA: 50S ribosomal protein L1 [Chloroflexota bacterium]|nr:50S ribosomal protein L1 [Chloroflexota bacterium]